MSDIKELIEEYSSLTGRPAATISISEYIELKRYSESGACHEIRVPEYPDKSTYSALRKDVVYREEREPKHEQITEFKEPEESVKRVQKASVQKITDTAKKQDETALLKMLSSIPG